MKKRSEMNKYQEALNRLIGITHNFPFKEWQKNDNKEMNDLLQELVDKATGQKKHIENCKEREYINHNYCYACGQKLDWSDDNE